MEVNVEGEKRKMMKELKNLGFSNQDISWMMQEVENEVNRMKESQRKRNRVNNLANKLGCSGIKNRGGKRARK